MTIELLACLSQQDITENPKKSRTETNLEKNDVSLTSKSEAVVENKEDELEAEAEDEYEEENDYGDYQDNSYYYNEEEYEVFDDGLF